MGNGWNILEIYGIWVEYLGTLGGIGGKYEGFGREMSGISWDIRGNAVCGMWEVSMWVMGGK